jgi:carnosine N-methyltransferase
MHGQAKNVVNYMKIIHDILAPGGVWINLGSLAHLACLLSHGSRSAGPLLWHWENNSTSDVSIELDLAEVKSLARSVGFEIKVPLSFALFRICSLTRSFCGRNSAR